MKPLIIKFFAFVLCFGGLANASVRTELGSRFLARGEQVFLEVLVADKRADAIPAAPVIEGVSVDFFEMAQPRLLAGRRLEYRYQYILSSYQVGRHTIPPIVVSVGGVRIMTDAVDFEVFDPNELKWQEAKGDPAKGFDGFRYACILKVPDKDLYQNQSFPGEIKVYIPDGIGRQVVDWGVPEFERDGLAVWRFEPGKTRGFASLLGGDFMSRSYPTTMTAIRSGPVEIGPATVRIIYGKRVFRGFNDRVNVQTTLDVPKLSFEAKELPGGAPAGFDNAVGNFTLGTAIKETDVTEGEPIAMDIVVSGKGNLDNLRSPRMTDESGWKVYDASPNQRGEERRELNGTVVFSQFIRPLEMKTQIPSFKLVFFDPDKAAYETVTTESIPLAMKPALGGGVMLSGPPQAAGLPVERMSDILALMDNGNLLQSRSSKIPGWLVHVLAGGIVLFLLGRIAWIRYGHLLEKNPKKMALKKDIAELANTPAEDATRFLRAAGAFIEKWFPTKQGEELQEIMEERDRICFRADKGSEPLPRSRRDQILKSLRKASAGLVIVFLSFLAITPAEANEVQTLAEEAYDSARYEEAAKVWLDAGPYEELSADTLYNIGNSCYRMGAPGQAALYFRRALVRDSNHEEARQNLRFIERKYGSITVERPAYQYAIGKVPLGLWKNGFYAGAWLLVIGLLVFPATRPGSKWRVAGVSAFVLAPLMISVGALGWRYFPSDAAFAAVEKQAVIVGDKVVLHTDAARTSAEVIDAPPGSLGEVLKRSGKWIYLGFASKTRGWVPEGSVEMVIPKEKPEAPKLKKSEADGSSA
ncbi:MAG: hypothetical protein ACSHX7_00780 [Luteolibacter sp.]